MRLRCGAHRVARGDMSGDKHNPYGHVPPHGGDNRMNHPGSSDPEWLGDDDPLAELARLVGEPEPHYHQPRNASRHEPNFEDIAPPDGWSAEDDYDLSPQEPDLFAGMDDPALHDEYAYDETEPLYADDGHMPPHGDGVVQQPVRRKSGLLTIGTVLTVVGVGAVAIFGYSLFGSATNDGPPPLIRAEDRPVKEELIAEAPAKDNERAPIADQQTLAMEPEEPAERPVALPGDVSRVITPGSPSGQNNSDGEDVRRVRTIIVGPDGRVVEPSDTAGTGTPATAGQVTSSGAAGTPSADMPGEPEAAPMVASAPTSMDDLMASAAGSATAGNAGGTPAGLPPISVDGPVEIRGAPDSPAEGMSLQTGNQFGIMEEPATPSVPMPAPRPANIRSVPQAGAPTQLVAAAPAQAAPVSSTPAVSPRGGFVVQVSSQRTEAEARSAFLSLQQRYPTILGSYQPLIQQANLGDRGTYYRVRIGPMASREDANLLCNNLRNAGGECIVQSN